MRKIRGFPGAKTHAKSEPPPAPALAETEDDPYGVPTENATEAMKFMVREWLPHTTPKEWYVLCRIWSMGVNLGNDSVLVSTLVDGDTTITTDEYGLDQEIINIRRLERRFPSLEIVIQDLAKSGYLFITEDKTAVALAISNSSIKRGYWFAP